MKIYILGSNNFVEEMVSVTEKLQAMGRDAWIHPNYIAYVKGELKDEAHKSMNGTASERAAVKKENDYIRQHYKHILESDAILIINAEKKGIKNYIGGNVLIEMGQAHVHNKKIYFLYGMPENSPYQDEIEAMDPVCLGGDLTVLPN